MENTWKPMVAGILDIVAGTIGLIIALLLSVGIGAFLVCEGGIAGIPGPTFVPAIIAGLAVPLAIMDILAIVGGVYALRRRIWGLALAGSIAACFASWPLGIAAVVFTVTSKNEFE